MTIVWRLLFLVLCWACCLVQLYHAYLSTVKVKVYLREWKMEMMKETKQNFLQGWKEKLQQPIYQPSKEELKKPDPVFSNKAPLFRQKTRKTMDRRSSDHKKLLGRAKRIRPPSKYALLKQQRLQELGKMVTFQRDIQSTLSVEEIKQDPTFSLIETIAKAADQRKTNYVHVIHVAPSTEITSFVMIIEGNSKPQNQAISLAIQEQMKEVYHRKPIAKTGQTGGGWIVLDYESILIHILTPPMRNYYQLEKRWKAATIIDMNYLFPDRPEPLKNWQSYQQKYLSSDTFFPVGDDLFEEEVEDEDFDRDDYDNTKEIDPFWK